MRIYLKYALPEYISKWYNVQITVLNKQKNIFTSPIKDPSSTKWIQHRINQ